MSEARETEYRMPRAGDELCNGCWGPASEVGHLTNCYLVTSRVRLRYCAACLQSHLDLQRAITELQAEYGVDAKQVAR